MDPNSNDGSDIGTAMKAAFQANIDLNTHTKLGWVVRDPMSVEEIEHEVVEEHAWVAVVGECPRSLCISHLSLIVHLSK